MKKLMAALLATSMMLGIGATAFAAPVNGEDNKLKDTVVGFAGGSKTAEQDLRGTEDVYKRQVVLENDGGRLSSRLWGPTTKMARVENDLCSGPLRFFIEFLPGGMSALTGWAQAELADRRLPLWQVSPGLERALFEALESSRDLSGLIARMDEILLSQREIGLPAPLREAMAALQCSGGMLPVRQLGALGHYSERHLGRLFRQHIGMGAKEFSRLIRINLLLKRLEGPNVFSLTELAQEFGFYDQAHFINDFKSVCGVPPGEYRKNQSVFYNETYKF